MTSRIGIDRLLIAVVAVAAVAVIAASVVVIKQSNRIDSVQRRIGIGSIDQAAGGADNDAHNRHITLVTEDKSSRVDGVLTTKGTGFLTGGTLKDPSAGNYYQLWADTPTATVSLGLVKDASTAFYFRVPQGTKRLFLSEESASGAAVPSAPVVSTSVA